MHIPYKRHSNRGRLSLQVYRNNRNNYKFVLLSYKNLPNLQPNAEATAPIAIEITNTAMHTQIICKMFIPYHLSSIPQEKQRVKIFKTSAAHLLSPRTRSALPQS